MVNVVERFQANLALIIFFLMIDSLNFVVNLHFERGVGLRSVGLLLRVSLILAIVHLK